MELDAQEVTMLFYICLAMLAGIAIIGVYCMVTLSKNTVNNQLKVHQLELEHEKELMAKKIEVQEDTLTHVARELHDNIRQAFIYTRMNLYNLETVAENEKERRLQPAIRLVEKAIEDLDDLSVTLNSDWIRRVGLIEALEEAIEKLVHTELYVIETHISQNYATMDPERELYIFRIVQEAFNNIIKHSGAKKVIFSLQNYHDHALFTITDDGKGFDLSSLKKKKGTGLYNMQSRANALDAQLTFNATPEKGTSVMLSVPFNIQHTARKN